MKYLNLLWLGFLLNSAETKAQTVSGFEEMALPAATFWNGSDGSASAINSGNASFPTVWDTSFGGFWKSGFAASTMEDTVTGNYSNPYSVISGSGADGSPSYGVNYGSGYFLLKGNATGKQLQGAWLNNNTYAFKSMLNGDAFSKKFGGSDGNNPDFFRLIFNGYLNGDRKKDSVVFYLADFRSPLSQEDYIVRQWTWVDFTPFGNVDSVAFYFESSDVGQFGINTPLYFCIDNLITADSPAGIAQVMDQSRPEVYPNPTEGILYLRTSYKGTAEILNLSGQLLIRQPVGGIDNNIDLSMLPAGIYLLRTGSVSQKVVVSQP
jgi:hypothetical protein